MIGSTRVWTAGTGEAIVLLHGAWGGAEAYWSKVTDELAKTHMVIAPELPGVGNTDEPPVGGFRDYATWLGRLLIARGQEEGGRRRQRLRRHRRLVLRLDVSRALRRPRHGERFSAAQISRLHPGAGPHGFLRNLARTQFRTHIFGPDALRSGFADRANVPAEIEQLLSQSAARPHRGAARYPSRAGAQSPPPDVPALILFGAADKVPLVDRRAGKRFGRTLGNGDFVRIEGAGQLPQVEKPDDFLRELRRFLKKT